MYYISTGKLTRMYTLRSRTVETESTIEGPIEVEVDYYICNLSTDACKARKKAELVSLNHGQDLAKGEPEDLEEIRRRSSAEVLAATLAAEKRAEKEQLERQNRRLNEGLELIARGEYPFGKFKGGKVAEYPRSYAQYMLGIETEEGNREDDLLRALQKLIVKTLPMLVNLPKANGKYAGEPKKRQDFSATIVESFSFEGFYGRVHIVKMVTRCGALLMYKGSAGVQGDIGDKLMMKATVKEHGEYEGENFTQIQRIKLI